MKERCFSQECKDYERYGGRGITICEEWLSNFEAFERWAIDNGYKQGLTIDRIDNNSNYEPDNCRFVTPKEQARNRCNNRMVGNLSLAEYCEKNGLNYKAIKVRLTSLGWSLDRALSAPIRKHVRKYNVKTD